ncbi:MAG: type II toxin-antitoxin system RelE/ParE family toxin [Alphaproteobacteria bacterium]|nr:type II toxin-antitoxin system RelE/ParE family toxin [Alphaproteobacteria bacterium]MCB9793033.1 type II toxin-antitoxin system RelE/ParE family toxin [Alphaproteobacteria bacterium]
MIRSFKTELTRKLCAREPAPAFPPDLQRRAQRKLRMLDAATRLQDLRVPPGNRLEALAGARAGQHSIRVNRQWRICFIWRDGDAYEVEVVDYHP